MQADPSPSVPGRDDPACRAPDEGVISLDVDAQTSEGLADGGDVDAGNAEEGIGPVAPGRTRV